MNEGQALTYHLAVRSDFRTYRRGDLITNPSVVTDVLSGEDHVHVVKLAAQASCAAADAVATTPSATETLLHPEGA